ncbi:myrosinase 1-like [Aphomia sociella]
MIFSGLSRGTCSELSELSFPAGFKFGVATSAYQIEGAWNVSDKGLSAWDAYIHEHSNVTADHSTADVACDSYHLWRRDIEMLTELGVDFYRFSLSWSRMMPTGYSNHISEDGKRYYNNLIDGLIEKGIEPVVTLYHWDIPLNLQSLGGWTNPYITDWFADYAREMYSLFADRVKIWITLNEPIMICDLIYTSGYGPPGVVIPDNVGTYICNKNVLIAHAKAYRVYDEEFRPIYHGMVSIINNIVWYEPASEEFTDLARLALLNTVGRFSHAIFSKEGGWPPEVESTIAINNKKLGYHMSRLPAFTKEEIDLVKGTFDFYGLNHYTSRIIREPLPGENLISHSFIFSPEFNYVADKDSDWTFGANGWFISYPVGFRRLLNWVKQEYGDVKIFVLENGYPTGVNNLDDDDRIKYNKDYIEQMHLAIEEDGVNVIGYTAWSLMDNLEWREGYRSKFGLYYVNFTDPQRTRIPRKSAKYYSEFIRKQKLIQVNKYKNGELYTLCSYLLLLIVIVFGTVGIWMYCKSKDGQRKLGSKEGEVKLDPLLMHPHGN